MKLTKKILTLLLILLPAILLSCASNTPENTEISMNSTIYTEANDFVKNMGVGYNLGNTMESCGGGSYGGKVANIEVAWGAPITTKEIFEDLKKRGIDTIRIPVAWSNLMGENYTINPNLMSRVEEIVNMVINTDMYAIVNIHWDGGWIHDFPTNWDETEEHFKRFWTQIADNFKDYGDHLLFESLNEEGCFDDVWNRYSDGDNSPKKKTAFDILNYINQLFTDIVRGSGGNNATRYLLIAGYATDIDLTCSKEFKMPVDPVKHSAVSVHYYTPSTFAILEKDADWGKSAYTWGTNSEIEQLKSLMNKMKVNFIDKGIPVILGEYGTVENNKDRASIIKYLSSVAQEAWKVGMCPVLWGGSVGIYDRVKKDFTYPELREMYKELGSIPR